MSLKLRIIPVLFAALLITSCTADKYFDISGGREGQGGAPTKAEERVSTLSRRVMLMVSGGKNSLYSFLRQDIEDLENSVLPGNFAGDNVLVVLYRNGSYTLSDAPTVLFRLYRDHNGDPVRDTIKVWDPYTPIFGNNTLEEAFGIVKREFPAAGYGMVLSSHGSGYLPEKYYSDPSEYERLHPVTSSLKNAPRMMNIEKEVFEPLPEWPAVKSIGQDLSPDFSVEMELKKLRNSIPYHLDYILLDACLMAGVETAYELRDKADYVGFSPTEVMADGFDYSLLTTRLLQETPDPVQVCRDYMAQYKDKERSDPWATISIVRTDKLEALAAVAKDLFERYRNRIAVVNASKVQQYFRSNYHFFYDFRDILEQSGVSQEDMAALDKVLEECVVYKDCTETFFSIELLRCCGLSMYLPRMGSAVLDKFYMENIDWNSATELVK